MKILFYFNMKQARPWMLANPKIIWQFHAHPVHQQVSIFFRLLRFRKERQLDWMRLDSALIKSRPRYISALKNIDTCWCTGWAWNCQIIFGLNWLLLHRGSGFQWYRTYERGYETSGSHLRFMLRRSSLVECVSVLHGTCLQSVEFFFQQSPLLVINVNK
jgi:hypothetical protein